jgi:hypothetical protein
MEFLFDDEWVDRKAGVQRVLGQPRKGAEPVLQGSAPWEAAGVSSLHALLFDAQEQKFKLWYRAQVRKSPVPGEDRPDIKGAVAETVPSSEQERGEHRSFLCYAESTDGTNWVRPSLGLFQYQDSRQNNILCEAAEGDGAVWNVVKDPDDHDPARRYKALGFGHCAESSVRDGAPGTMGVCVAYSPDGLSWSPPKLVMSTKDMTDADCILGQRDPATGKWLAFFRPRTRPKRRFIGYALSDDFDHWEYPRMLLTPDEGDDEWTEFYGLTATAVGRWRVGCLWVFHNNPEFSPMTAELVYSRDGINFHRAMPGSEFLPLGPVGSFDSRMVHTLALIERPGEFFLFYHGTNREHGSDRGQKMPPGRYDEGEPPKTGIGLARIPWGQFCGYRAAVDGMVESRWLCNYGQGGVQAVAAVEDGGWVRAKIVDQFGQVIPGWDRSASRARVGEDGRLHFSWGRDELVGSYGQCSDDGGVVGHVVKLRFYLHGATLFGFQVGEEGAMPPYVG